MMKRTLLALALASAAAVPGMAADLPSRAPPPVFVPPPPIFTWTGFYIGGVAGVQFASKHDLRDVTGLPSNPRNANNNGSDKVGFTGGGTIGYNYQIGSIVIGVEGDASYIDRKAQRTAGNPGNNTYIANVGRPSEIFGTARARVGYAFDRLLIFATGGGAFAGGDGVSTVRFNPPGAGGIGTYRGGNNNNDTQVGFSVGGGIEYAIFGNWSVKGEYLFNSLGDNRITFRKQSGPGPASFSGKLDNQFSVARLGVNYRF